MRTQLPLKFNEPNAIHQEPIIDTYKGKLLNLLSGDLDFHDQNNTNTLHNFHSFPAKFPPQLPGRCIQALTDPNDRVLDPGFIQQNKQPSPVLTNMPIWPTLQKS